MSSSLVLPASTQTLVHAVPISSRHPGLQLDKLSDPRDLGDVRGQARQKQILEDVCATSGEQALLERLSGRRRAFLDSMSADSWRCTTTGPLTLHLARASALENAGICLHPQYGFAYLPGSGLKGMARAYAETLWLASQDDKKGTWYQIERVFGWAPHAHDGKSWRPPEATGHASASDAQVGAVVFHDAWPETWPRLTVDIVNNHHSAYYQQKDDPGDWENPVLVYFLSISPETTFSFAVSARVQSLDGQLVLLARDWLTGALCHMGAGAKTAAGYGVFRVLEGEAPALESPAVAIHEERVELVTPAFFAGAGQKAEDCTLRSATLRGLLRWWWRTLHAGFLDTRTLRAIEASLWGDTNAGGAVRLTVGADSGVRPILYDYKERYAPKPAFKRQHGLQDPPNRKTTQGLFYASYGMDDGSRGKRWYLEPGASWRVRMIARATQFSAGNASGVRLIEPDMVLAQARAALHLLCHFGGLGSKGRKGFGSLADTDGLSVAACEAAARDFRRACGLPDSEERDAASPALGKRLSLEVPTPWKDPWFALDQVGFAAQGFAQKYKHRTEKAALGLPRKVHGPRRDPLRNQDSHKPPRELQDAKGRRRHASPVHYHLAKNGDGRLTVRVTAFSARDLPDHGSSRRLLDELIAYLEGDLQARVRRHEKAGQEMESAPRSTQPAASAGTSLPKAWDEVDATLLEERTKKGKWRARHAESGMTGEIRNSEEVPADQEAGKTVRLVVLIPNKTNGAFLWPTDAVRAQAQAKRSEGPKRGPRGPGRGHRR